MSKNVTLDQAQKLCAICFNRLVDKSYNVSTGEIISHVHVNANALDGAFYSCPTVSEALDYLREEKGIACGVHPFAIYEDMPDGDQHFVKWGYRYVAFKGLSEWQDMNKDVFDTHPLASSALLDAVLTYLEQKEQK
ncbi:hypothetical protein [Dysgonomonas sp.]|uniref:hypothetical protein n=1 Tax=Dysgonomonas sp. TaxID=1891233 RepID=UPI0027B8D6A4|nr:hypothetical protein [Dysgonomonas sp.]